MIYTTKSESETADLGRKIGEQLSGGEIITLSGDLGAGKTALTKGIALGLGVCETVVSPTFTLMNEYSGRLTLYHYDAYRLGGGREAYEAGITEYFGEKEGVCVIEWWENIADALAAYPKKHIAITVKDQNTRIIEIVDK
ncbi:tRNA (adenosine(37)-N6)-threonylcarbamoyltransferase complex ATPase subunit type 1 TsaE [Pumilibacter intestinalis]|jgi:tRNA threonylcarbamoyladenosine biosynthesis protein TsaE|uniref:tRNA (adenosine(37)-N6)-threonylcarbamoyltransferase complex ATPase subunit type 1 TsaE n=1 Tax=Pumilibacter intestinalis TaxID=2941511 RepID=UPI00203C0966|nr:tRNA (adenosine(37)-N6)-threonylcarbamoyltransferase complex ATPase subunit type 1 TsaE [Pumilibacter intestinalis]